MVKWSLLQIGEGVKQLPSAHRPLSVVRLCSLEMLVSPLNKLMSKVLWLLILIDDCAPVRAAGS